MRLWPPALLLAAAVFLSLPALAQSQSEMNVTSFGEAKLAEQEMRAVYERLLAKVSPAGKTKLRAADAAWLRYRTAQCAFDTLGSADGSVHPMIVNQCYARITNQWKALLDAQLHCEEGDLSCGRQ